MEIPDVAFFLANLGGGGAEKAMANLARDLQSRSLKVEIVLGEAKGPNLALIPDNVNLVDLRTRYVAKWLVELTHYLRTRHPKVLISGLHHVNLVSIWAKALSGANTKLVVTVHGPLSLEIGKSKKTLAKVIPLLVKMFYTRADKIVCVSSGIAKELVERYRLPEDKIEVIYNPVITSNIFVKAQEPVYHTWFEPGQPPVILSAGRLTQAKDFETLIRAFALVREKVHTRLMILGEGPDRPKLERLVESLQLSECVCMPGFVDNPYKYMKRSAVFVLSSRWEGFGNVIVEALALGIPVVSTNCPSGPAEILANGKWGKLVPVGDPEALSLAILEALNDDGSRGIERAMCFTAENIGTRYLEMIRPYL